MTTFLHCLDGFILGVGVMGVLTCWVDHYFRPRLPPESKDGKL